MSLLTTSQKRKLKRSPCWSWQNLLPLTVLQMLPYPKVWSSEFIHWPQAFLSLCLSPNLVFYVLVLLQVLSNLSPHSQINHFVPQLLARQPPRLLASDEAGKSGRGRECPSSASSRIGMRQKATPPPRFALNEDMTQGGMASKTETLWPLSETLWAWKPWSVRSKRHGLLMTLYHLPRVALHYLRENSSWSACKVPSGGKCSGPEADATWCNPGHTSTLPSKNIPSLIKKTPTHSKGWK